MKELTIIIVSFNVKDYLRQCLESIFRTADKSLVDVIVIDNNSHDQSTFMVQQDFPNVTLISNSKNLGFAAANNIALKMAKTKYVMLLNPDVMIKEQTIATLLEFLKNHKNAGLLGPKISNSDGSLQISCRKFPGIFDALFYMSGICRIFPRTKTFRAWLLQEFDHRHIQEVECISGACMLLRRDVLLKIGLLDEQFFMYSEDIDLCMRIRRLQKRIVYLPTAEIIHYGGRSSQSPDEWRQSEEMFKSWLKLRKKYSLPVNAATFNLAACFIFILKIIVLRGAQSKYQDSKKKMYLRLLVWYLRHLI